MQAINKSTTKLMIVLLALSLILLMGPALAQAGRDSAAPLTSIEEAPSNPEPIEPDTLAYHTYGLSLDANQTPETAGQDTALPEGVSENWWATVQEELRRESFSPAALSSPASWSADGENADDRFGFSVAGAGDVNGDGFADVVVGAYAHTSDTGKVYLFLGENSAIGLSTTASFTANGEAEDDNFGYSVAGAGDVNGDGYSDVVVGAYAHDGAKGKVYVYQGSGGGLSATPSFTATGNNFVTPDNLGRSVAGAGDFNGDGYADIIVGANGFNSFSGYFVIYWGGASGPDSGYSSTVNGLAGSQLGRAVAGAGDVNGDGFADVIVGAFGHNSFTGQAYIYHGSASGISYPPQLTLSGEGSGDYFGIAVAGAGDVNGDGYSDVLVGAYGYGSSNTGRAYLYHGSSTGVNNSPAFIATGESTSDLFGVSVAGVGDTNGDGYGDVMIGASGYDRSYLYQGSSSGLSTTPVFTPTGGDKFGGSVASAGDVNGDGFADVLVGAWDAGSGSEGQALLYQGSGDTLSASPAFTASGESSSFFGYSVAGAGDVNGDGYGDVIVGDSDSPGRAYIYHGSGNGLSSSPAAIVTGEVSNGNFARAIAGAGDVNGDGYSDVIVGDYGYNNNTGRVYLYHGSSSGINATAAFTISGEGEGDNFGRSVAGAGDVNGDGYADVVVGVSGYNNNTGRMYLYHGSGGGLSASPAFTAIGEETSDHFGRSVAGAGDVNGDGYGDVMVGAHGYNNNTGRVYVYHGSGGGLSSSPAFTATGENEDDTLGRFRSIAGVGDVNGDGYADVIVGANSYNNYAGRVYLYHGSGAGLGASPAFIATGEGSYHNFGNSVAEAGDVNGDGYADVLVGAYGYNDTGRVYLYHGSSSGINTTPAFTATGEEEGEYHNFGRAIAGAGDANGDGYADVIVGADSYGDDYEGRVYLYQGNQAGRTVLAHQRRGDDSLPVQNWGLAHDDQIFQVNMSITSPRGRERFKIEVEACPPGLPFGDASCKNTISIGWSDVTATSGGVGLTLPIENLTANTLYRWRARVLYAPYTVNKAGITAPPNPAHSPWRRFNGQANEADIRVGTPSVAAGKVYLPMIIK